MKEVKNKKQKILTAGIVVITLILAGVATFTALKLYQVGQKPVAPTAPESTSACQVIDEYVGCRSLTFSLAGATPPSSPATTSGPTSTATPTPTIFSQGSPTITQTPTSTATPTPTSGAGGGITNTPTNTPILTTTPTTISGSGADNTASDASTQTDTGETVGTGDQLPDAGISLPTVLSLGLGILLILLTFALVLPF